MIRRGSRAFMQPPAERAALRGRNPTVAVDIDVAGLFLKDSQVLEVEHPDLQRRIGPQHGSVVDGAKVEVGGYEGRDLGEVGTGVDDRHGRCGPVVNDDASGRLVDIEIGTGHADTDTRCDLEHLTIQMPDCAGVALEEPGAAIVGVQGRAFSSVGSGGGKGNAADEAADGCQRSERSCSPQHEHASTGCRLRRKEPS